MDVAPQGRTSPIRTILVVDDDVLVVKMCSAGLWHAGYDVVTASGAMQAIEMCHAIQYRIDLALIDAIMPMMSGPELEDCLRSLGIKVLTMSGYPEHQIFEKLGRSLDYDHFLAKPFTVAELVGAVQRALDDSPM